MAGMPLPDQNESNLNLSSYTLTPNNFDNVLQSHIERSFSVTHTNIRSLNRNIDDLKTLYECSISSKFDIIGLSEVWNVSNTALLGLGGYKLEVNCRQGNVRGGGVGAYILSSLRYKRLVLSEIAHAESLWLELSFDRKKVIVGVIYRKPNTNIKEFQETLLTVLHSLKLDKHHCLLMGDFNIDLTDTENDPENILTLMQCIGLHQLISSPTRVTINSASLIDHLYTNMDMFNIQAGTIEADVSDHFPIFAVFESPFYLKNNVSKVRKATRSYKHYNVDSYCSDLANAKWDYVYKCKDVNDAYSTFYGIFEKVFDKHAPFRSNNTTQSKCYPKNPWVTKAILKSIKRKYKLYIKYRSSNFDKKCEREYKKYRNVLTTVLKNAKRMYYSSMFYDNKQDSGKTWKTINELMNSGKGHSTHVEIEKLVIHNSTEEKTVCSAKDIAEELNNYFVTVGPNLAKEIPETSTTIKEFLGEGNDKSFFWRPVIEKEVLDYLCTLDIKKSHGYDNLSARLLRDAACFVCKPLTYVFNLSLETGIYPQALKIAKVTPIYKKGPKSNPKNYRPISILPIIGKGFEKNCE